MLGQYQPDQEAAMTDVRYESHDRVALITIDRAAQRNSINNAVVEGLHEAWRRFAPTATASRYLQAQVIRPSAPA